MKNKTFTPMGALHPILFFAGVYIVALLLSIFICSSIFYSLNSRSASVDTQMNERSQPVVEGTTAALVLR